MTKTVVGRFDVEGTPVQLSVQITGSPSPDAGQFISSTPAAASLVGPNPRRGVEASAEVVRGGVLQDPLHCGPASEPRSRRTLAAACPCPSHWPLVIPEPYSGRPWGLRATCSARASHRTPGCCASSARSTTTWTGFRPVFRAATTVTWPPSWTSSAISGVILERLAEAGDSSEMAMGLLSGALTQRLMVLATRQHGGHGRGSWRRPQERYVVPL